MSKTSTYVTTAAAVRANPQASESLTPTAEQWTPREKTDPAGLNAERSEEALFKFQEAYEIGEGSVDARDLQPGEAKRRLKAAEALLAPSPLLKGLGEVAPYLGSDETYDAARHAMVDTLEHPTTPAVTASDKRMRLLHKAGALQIGIDASVTANAKNSLEKMLCHQLAAAHVAVMNIHAKLRGLEGVAPDQLPLVELARLANAGARLTEAYANGFVALRKVQTGGTQRVVVQHQHLAVTQNGPAVVMNTRRGSRRVGGWGRTRGSAKNARWTPSTAAACKTLKRPRRRNP